MHVMTKRHLARRNWRRAACGLDRPAQVTFNPELVTCARCKKTLAMIDAEVAQRRRLRNDRVQ